MIGASHGNAFRSPDVSGFVDPLRPFRDNPLTGAQAFESCGAGAPGPRIKPSTAASPG
jgi:hypothetical protein